MAHRRSLGSQVLNGNPKNAAIRSNVPVEPKLSRGEQMSRGRYIAEIHALQNRVLLLNCRGCTKQKRDELYRVPAK